MTVAFKELGGSPLERYHLDGFHAQREFLIDWEDRDAFAVEILGLGTQHGGSIATHYPGKPSVRAIDLRYEPFDPDSPDAQAFADVTEGPNSYSGSFAKARVEYRTVNTRDREDGPKNTAGTHLTYRMMFAAREVTLSPRGWLWIDDAGISVPSDLEIIKRIPTTEHHLTWHQVINPPWTTIHQLQGTVNHEPFLGCPAGTLLFEGAEANKLFRAGLDSGASDFTWKIHYLFLERSVKHAGQTYGWNHFYRESPAGWIELTNGTEKMYDSADLGTLFSTETTGG